MGEWHLWIDETPRPGWANMALDQTLLDRAEQYDESWLRLYTWWPHCLSFGRHEPALQRYDTNRIAAMGLDTVRRPTGGRAVWHSRELTYAVAAPCRRFGSLQQAYLEIHQMLAAAFASRGIQVALASRTSMPRLDAGACFSQPAGGEVMARGRKVVGSAQLRRGSGFLQHGSILLEDQQELVARVTKGGESLSSPTPGAVLPIFTPKIGETDLADAITLAAKARWSGTWTGVTRPDVVLCAASGHYSQFRSAAWTWER